MSKKFAYSFALLLIGVALTFAFTFLTAQSQEETGTLLGQVEEVVTRNRIPDARIDYIGPKGVSGSSYSNAKGQFEISGLPAGEYKLTVTHKGYVTANHLRVTIAAGSDTVMVVKMRKASGWLQLDGKGYAVAPHKDVLNIGKKDGFAIGLWFYLNRYPQKNECWILIAKPDSYAIQIMDARRYNALDYAEDKIADDEIALVWSALHVEEDGTKTRHSLSHKLTPDENIFQKKWCYAIIAEGKAPDVMPFLGGKDCRVLATEDLMTFTNPPISEQPYKILSSSEHPVFVGGIDGQIKSEGKLLLSPSGYFDGRIDEVRIYDGGFFPATGDEIAKFAISDVDENTTALWHFEDGDGSTKFTDASGNGCVMYAKGAAKSIEPKGSK